ncbi:MAG: Gfo/Idh/MocA family oxidoreductase [Anaerolineaceae bacterium]|nr:Gfo/Idh/MocA family oxidoreductase [Anaerolineaceae bacterium]
MTKPIRTAMIGCGGMARWHIRQMLKQTDTTEIVVLCEPSSAQLREVEKIYREAKLPLPPNEPDLAKLLKEYDLDAAFIVTPHVFHHDQTQACLEAGLDVLLEKPMVMNAAEARSLIKTMEQTGRLLVVAFPGSLSPQVRKAVRMLRSGEIGSILSIDAVVWQHWKQGTSNTWRQDPVISGGGFLFDTGAHMLNTVVDLAGEEFDEVSAYFDHRGTPVEIMATISGKLKSGAFVTMHACGEAIEHTCHSMIRVFTNKAILKSGIWGERLELQTDGAVDSEPVQVSESLGVWEQFLAVRDGQIPNPCPPEVGLRMAMLYDAIKESAANHGRPVKCK